MFQTGRYRAKLRIRDTIRYSPLLKKLAAAGTAMRLPLAGSAARKAALVTRARRHTGNGWLGRWVDKRASRLWGRTENVWKRERIGWEKYPSAQTCSSLDRTIVLKAPGPNGEKGVILLMMEANWLRLFAGTTPNEIAALDECYTFILSTGWSPTDYALIALAAESLRHPFFVQSCNYGEIPLLESFHPRVRCLPMIACDWINPDLYSPKPFSERETDILMVANWAPFKRHWHLYEALAKMPTSLRITLIGQPEQGHTAESSHKQAKRLGVKQDIRFIDQATIDEVQQHQCDSRISLILSRREGCCVAVCESLFAGSPVGMVRGAHVGPLAYINDQTGAVLGLGRTDRQLMAFLERASSCSPREWAMNRISCFASIKRVNEAMKAEAIDAGRPWTVDLATPCWRPYPRYVDFQDHERLLPVYQKLHLTTPALFNADLSESVRPPQLPVDSITAMAEAVSTDAVA